VPERIIQRGKAAAEELMIKKERKDKKNRSQDPRMMNTRSLEYESIMLDSFPSNFFFVYFFFKLC